MDRLISEQDVLNAICKVCAVEVNPSECRYRKGLFGGCKEYEAIKVIPSAEPYKGMTNGEVITKILKDAEWAELSSDFGLAQEDTIYIKVGGYWWNSLYDPQKSEDKK